MHQFLLISFSQQKLANSIAERLTLESNNGQVFSINSCYSSNHAIELAFDPNYNAIRHSLLVKPHYDKLRLAESGSIIINVNHPKTEEIAIPFKVILPFSVRPETIYFSETRYERKKARIKVISNYNEPFNVCAVRSENNLIKIINVARGDVCYDIDVTLASSLERKTKLLNDYILIDIDGYPNDTLRVHCYGRVR